LHTQILHWSRVVIANAFLVIVTIGFFTHSRWTKWVLPILIVLAASSWVWQRQPDSPAYFEWVRATQEATAREAEMDAQRTSGSVIRMSTTSVPVRKVVVSDQKMRLTLYVVALVYVLAANRRRDPQITQMNTD
jgi:hypothetical protein